MQGVRGHYRGVSLLVLLAVAALFAMPAMASATSHATLYVDDQGDNSIESPDPDDPDGPPLVSDNDCLTPTTPCQTIAYAITKAATSDEIQVGGGSYPESVALADSELLNGEDFIEDPDAPPETPDDTDGATVLSGDVASVCPTPTIAITSAATVQDLTIRSTPGCDALQLDAGSEGAIVQRNVFDDSSKIGGGVNVAVLDGAGASTIRANEFSDSDTIDFQTAITVAATSSPTIGGATLADDGNTFTGFGIAIAVDGAGASPQITNNTISGVHDNGATTPGAGIKVSGGATPATISGNTIALGSSPAVGIDVSDDGAPAAISSNTISATAADVGTVGISLEGDVGTGLPLDVNTNTLDLLDRGIVANGGQPQLTGNQIHHSGTVGIEIAGKAHAVLTQNLVQDAASGTATPIGILISDPGALLPDQTTAQLDRNVVFMTTTGISVSDAGLVTLSQDAVRSSGDSALIAVDTSDDPPPTAGDVNAVNVNLIAEGTAVATINLNATQLSLTSSIVGAGGATDDGISAAANGATCVASYSRLPATEVNCSDPNGPTNTHAAPEFAGADDLAFSPTDEFKLKSDAGLNTALIDGGDPNLPTAFPATDLYGQTRVVDGDQDCADHVDIGAAELQSTGCVVQPPPPTPEPDPAVTTRATFRETPVLEILSIVSQTRLGNYRLCVDGPGPRQCGTFRAARRSGAWRHTVNWSQKFRYRGPGRYVAKWSTSSRQLGTEVFNWGPCAPGNLAMRGVWSPRRLIIIDRCRAIHGKPHTITHSNQDGDYHISFRHEEKQVPGVLEIVPRDQPRRIPPPKSGQRYRITGVYICDTFHGPVGKTEIHPVYRTERLSSSGQVLRTHTGGPQYPGTPSVSLRASGRFHCRNFAP